MYKYLKIEQAAVTALVGSLIFSPFGANKLLVFGGNFYPEPAIAGLLCWAFLRSRKFISISYKIISSKVFIFWFIACLLCAAIGIIFQHGSITESYSSFRGYMVFILGFCLASTMQKNYENYRKFKHSLLILAASSIISSVIYYATIEGWSVKRPYAIPALICLLLTIPQKALSLFLTIILAMYCGLTSGYRAFILYSLLASLAAFIQFNKGFIYSKGNLLKINKHKGLMSIALVTLTILAAPIGYDYFITWVNEDPSRYHQIIYKFQQQYDEIVLGQADINSEVRLGFADFIANNFLYFIFPSGFYDRNLHQIFSIWGGDTMSTYGSSPIKDGGYLFMSMSFGIAITLTSLAYCLYRFIKKISQFKPSEALAYFIYALIILLLFVSMGNIFLVIGISFFYGIVISLLIGRTSKFKEAQPYPFRMEYI